MINHFKQIVILVFIVLPVRISAQDKVMVDKIIAVVGGNVILQSDIESQYLQMMAQRQVVEKCDILESFLVQKLLVNQARIDSIEVGEVQIEMQLENRMNYFIEQAGSKEKLEEYFKRSLFQIKEDMRRTLKEQMIMQKMKGEITGDIKITPTEVKDYYENLPPDSIPMVNASLEYLQIMRYPPYTEQSIYEVKEKLLSLRKRILDGEKFSTLAYLYSEDPGSARSGGEIGFLSRGELDPEYAKTAFGLKENGVSGIVESQFGYHIIQLIARQNDKVNTRHILLKPKASEKEIKEALTGLDTIASLIKKDSIKFEDAALYYSQDKNSKLNKGKVVNPYNNSTKFEFDQLSQEDYYVLKKLEVGQMSEPFMSKDENKKDAFKIVKLIARTQPHKANLKEDYQLLQEKAMESKQEKVVQNWVMEKQKTTYYRIDDSYKSCDFKNKNWIK
jgi:peptidyl-prolyl cis-trans isomerase SurA